MNRIGFKTKLSNIAFVQQGQSPESIYYSDTEGTPFLQGNRTFGNLYPTFDTFTKKVTKLAKKGEVLMSVRAPVGDLNFAPCDLCIGRGLASLNAKSGNNNFLYYALKYNIGNLLKQGAATTFDSVNKDIINDFELIIPEDNKERDELEKVLSAIDAKIELNNKINYELEAMAKTIYDFWFIQFDFPNDRGKPYKTSGGKMIKNEKLKINIPHGWTESSLEGQISFDRGISYTSKNIESLDGIPMINLASIDINRNYRPNELKFFSGKYSQNKLVSQGCMLIACTDLTQNADIIGSPIFVPNEFDKYLYSMDLARINIITRDINDMFLYMTLRTKFYHRYIKYFASGTNVLHLNLDGILWYSLIKPPIELQTKFANLIRPFVLKQAQIINENRHLTNLREWLLPMFMNGQVKIN